MAGGGGEGGMASSSGQATATHINLQEGEVRVVEQALEHLQQRRQLIGVFLYLEKLDYLGKNIK